MFDVPWNLYPLAIIAVAVTGISKSGFGGGLGILAVPLMSLAVAPPRAAAILLPVLITIDLLTVYRYRQHFDRRNLSILLPGALMGIIFGSLYFRYLSDAHIRVLIGTLALLFVFNHLLRGQSRMASSAAVPAGLFWGTVAGFTSFGVHAGGPPVNIYLLPQKLDKTVFVGTTVFFFTTVNMLKVVPYTLLGQFSANNLTISLLLLPVAALGVWLGARLHQVISEERFYTVCYFFLLVTGVKIFVDGAAGLLR